MNKKRFDRYWKEMADKISWPILQGMVIYKSKRIGISPWASATKIFDEKRLIENLPHYVRKNLVAQDLKAYKLIITLSGVATVVLALALGMLFVKNTKQKSYINSLIGEPIARKSEQVIQSPDSLEEIASLEKQLYRKDKLLRDKDRKLSKLNARITDLRKRKSTFPKHIARTRDGSQNIANVNLVPENDTWKEKFELATAKIDGLKEQLTTTQNKLEASEQSLRRKSDELEFRKQKLDKSSKTFNEQVASFINENDILKTRLAALTQQNTELYDIKSSQVDGLMTKLQRTENSLEILLSKYERLQHVIEGCEIENQRLGSQLDSVAKSKTDGQTKEQKRFKPNDTAPKSKSSYHISKKFYDVSIKYKEMIAQIENVSNILNKLTNDVNAVEFMESVNSEDWNSVKSKSATISHFLVDIDLVVMDLVNKLMELSQQNELAKKL